MSDHAVCFRPDSVCMLEFLFLTVECKPLTDEQKYDWLNIAITEFRDVDLMKEIISEGACV